MRVLIEYKNKRVDIKTPISMRQKIDEKPELLAQLIGDAVDAVAGTNTKDDMSFDELADKVAARL